MFLARTTTTTNLRLDWARVETTILANERQLDTYFYSDNTGPHIKVASESNVWQQTLHHLHGNSKDLFKPQIGRLEISTKIF